MQRIAFCIAAASLALCASASAQTSYPMLMSLSPVAAQVGRSSEHEVASRYDMFGADRVLVTGEGVSAEVVTPMKPGKDGKNPTLTKIKLRFTVAADATPGVRDFRIATPNGVSTLGQIVVARDAIAVEGKSNNEPDKATEVTLPATICGAIEKSEDVDFYRFSVDAGRALTFHVRAMRLQNRIHDLQQHVDPIIFLRNSAGTTIAQSDNVFTGDPLLHHRFDQAGEYLLEIRDVRFQGNQYWQYSIEAHDRPFVTNVHPLGVRAGETASLEPVGYGLAANTASSATADGEVSATPSVDFTVPAGAPPGGRTVQLPYNGGLSNPVAVFVTDLPHTVEVEDAGSTPTDAASVASPGAVSGRIGRDADVDCYSFDARKGERLSFEVVARRSRSALDPVLRLLDAKGKRLAENDDLRLGKRNYQDSLIENWAATDDGRYTLEVRDLHLRGGDRFVYLLEVTRAEPYFELYLDTDKTQLTPGTNGVLFVNVVRKNGFTGDVKLHVDGLPAGVKATCGRILAGQRDGCIVFETAADAKPDVANITVTGTAPHKTDDGKTIELTSTAIPYQETYMPGGGRGHYPVEMHTVAIGAPSDVREVRVSTTDVTLKPGESKTIDVDIVRSPGYQKNIALEATYYHLSSIYADTLPPGVTVDLKNSKKLLTGKESKGRLTLKADAKAGPVEKQQFAVMANVSLNFVMKATYASPPITVTVQKP